MELKTYITNDTNNTINKNLTDLKEYDITLKNPENVINPTIMLNHRDEFTQNYAYIPAFSRYYFIRDITRVNRDLVQLRLEVDVLESYKEDILNSEGNISRNKEYNKYYDGGDYQNEVRKDHKMYKSDTTMTMEESVVLVTIGGE